MEPELFFPGGFLEDRIWRLTLHRSWVEFAPDIKGNDVVERMASLDCRSDAVAAGILNAVAEKVRVASKINALDVFTLGIDAIDGAKPPLTVVCSRCISGEWLPAPTRSVTGRPIRPPRQ